MPAELVAVDQLLDDKRFFEPFRRWFDPPFGRLSIPMETYLRLIPQVPVPPRLRGPLCGGVGLAVVAAVLPDPRPRTGSASHHLGEDHHALQVVHRRPVECRAHRQGHRRRAIDMTWLRADTIVVPADIKYPTDSRLLTKGVSKIARLVTRIQAVGIAPRTAFDDPTAAARQGTHRIGSKLRRRSEDAKADVPAIIAELASLAESTVEQAKRFLANARRCAGRPVRRLRRMLADLAYLIDALSQVITQTRLRLAGETPAGQDQKGVAARLRRTTDPQGQPRHPDPVGLHRPS